MTLSRFSGPARALYLGMTYHIGDQYERPIIINTMEEALEHCRGFLLSPSSRYYGVIVTEEDGHFLIHNRVNQPCYGFLRKYGPESDRPEDYRPSDLPIDFPNGKVVMIAIPLYNNGPFETFEEIWFSEKSPWWSILENQELVFKDDKLKGLILHDTDVNSTVVINMVKTYSHRSFFKTNFNRLMEVYPSAFPSELFYLSFVLSLHYTGDKWQLSDYYDLEKLVKKSPTIFGKTFLNDGAYARPVVEKVFYKEKYQTKILPHQQQKFVTKEDIMKLFAQIQEYQNEA